MVTLNGHAYCDICGRELTDNDTVSKIPYGEFLHDGCGGIVTFTFEEEEAKGY